MKRVFGIFLALVLVGIALSVVFQTTEAQLGKKQYVGAHHMTADYHVVRDSLRATKTTINGVFTSASNMIYTPTTVASAAGSITLPAGTVIGVTGTGKITRIAASTAGRIVYLYHATTDTLVDAVNLRLAGDFEATAGDVLVLCYSISGAAADTFWTEISRSAN